MELKITLCDYGMFGKVNLMGRDKKRTVTLFTVQMFLGLIYASLNLYGTSNIGTYNGRND